MTAATRLETALLDAAEVLMEVVGLPSDSEDSQSPRTPVSGSLVDRDAVPDGAFRAACFALDVVMVGMSVLDPDVPPVESVEDGLAAMMRAEDS